MRKIKSISFARGVALALACSIAAPGAAGTREGYDLWQQGDFFGAVREWRTAAVAGDVIAQFNLARAYQLGRGVPVDLKMAESWFGRAAAQGHLPSRDNYGLTLFQNGDREMAMPYIEDAAGRGDPRAQYVLGTALFNGDTIKKDWPRAYAMMTRASAAGIAAASASLAQMDKFIPGDQRQRGLVLARALETLAIRPQLSDTMIAEQTVARPSIATEDLPPSRIAAPPIRGAKPAAKPAFTAAAKPVKPAQAQKPVVAAKATSPVVKPQPKPAPKVAGPASAKPTPSSSGTWKVQLGAFGDAAKARGAWDAMHKRVGALGPYNASYIHAGKLTRLQTGSLPSRAAAQKLCATVKAAGQSCIPVVP